MFRAIGRFLVATAAGAGLGAVSALYRRHLIELEPRGEDEWAPATPAPQPTAAPAHPEVREAPITAPAPTPSPTQLPAQPTAADLAALQESVADLEAARTRLRERAAALRAEMEGGDA